jgi:hypothetical protein
MTRSAAAPALTLILSAAIVSAAFAQTPATAPTSAPAPAQRAKWIAPVKGVATIQIIRGDSKKIGGDLVTTFKVKNTSNGAIALLRIDEYWYDSSPKPKVVTGDTQRYPKPFNPGEVIEITTRSPAKPGAARGQWSFSHANGKVDPKVVKKFD